MAISQKYFIGSFATGIWAFLLGGWFFDFLIAGTPIAEFGFLVHLFVAALFLCAWGLSVPGNKERRDKLLASRGGRIAFAVVESLVILWSAGGIGAFLVWFWMVNLEKVASDAMQQVNEKRAIIFWLVVAACVVLGGVACYFRIKRAVRPNQLPDVGMASAGKPGSSANK